MNRAGYDRKDGFYGTKGVWFRCHVQAPGTEWVFVCWLFDSDLGKCHLRSQDRQLYVIERMLHLHLDFKLAFRTKQGASELCTHLCESYMSWMKVSPKLSQWCLLCGICGKQRASGIPVMCTLFEKWNYVCAFFFFVGLFVRDIPTELHISVSVFSETIHSSLHGKKSVI